MATCFVIERVPLKRVWLRRYDDQHATPCPGPFQYHNGKALIEDRESALPGPDGIDRIDVWESEYADDARWPKKCDYCPHEFTTERKQVFPQRLWKAVDGREGLWHLHESMEGCAPVGAMFYADWYEFWPGPDGRCLSVMTPAGVWTIDGPASDGQRCWRRTGTPPLVSVTPSIHFPGRFHGWLTNGELNPC